MSKITFTFFLIGSLMIFSNFIFLSPLLGSVGSFFTGMALGSHVYSMYKNRNNP